MIHYVGTDESGRINVTTPHEEYSSEDMVAIDFPDDFDFSKQNEYRIQNGELVHDPLPEPIEPQIAELKRKLEETDYIVMKIAESQVTGIALPDEDAERYAEMISQRQQWREELNELEAQL